MDVSLWGVHLLAPGVFQLFSKRVCVSAGLPLVLAVILCSELQLTHSTVCLVKSQSRRAA